MQPVNFLAWWMNVDEHGREKMVAKRGGFWEGKQEQILWSLKMPQIHLGTKGIFLRLNFMKFHFKFELQYKRCQWSLWCQPHYPWNKIIKTSSNSVFIPYTWRQLEWVNLVITLIMHRSTKSKVISKFSIGVPKSSRPFLALLLVFMMNHKVLIQFFACLSWFWGWTFQMHHFLPSSEWSRSPVQSVCRSLTFSPQNAHGLLARRIHFLQRFFTGRKSVAGWRTRAAWCVGGGGWVLV